MLLILVTVCDIGLGVMLKSLGAVLSPLLHSMGNSVEVTMLAEAIPFLAEC